jgi:hypothetical protein
LVAVTVDLEPEKSDPKVGLALHLSQPVATADPKLVMTDLGPVQQHPKSPVSFGRARAPSGGGHQQGRNQ